MIYLLLADGFEEVEALTPLDLLRRAGKEIFTVSVTSERLVRGAHGITVLADMTAEEAKLPCDEMLILPGGMPGTLNLDSSPLTERLLSEVQDADGYIAAICAAPMILGKRGLLKGKRATCYPGFEDSLTGATVVSAYAVSDGKIITATGAGAAVPFGGALVAALCGEEKADTLLKAFRYTGV